MLVLYIYYIYISSTRYMSSRVHSAIFPTDIYMNKTQKVTMGASRGQWGSPGSSFPNSQSPRSSALSALAALSPSCPSSPRSLYPCYSSNSSFPSPSINQVEGSFQHILHPFSFDGPPSHSPVTMLHFGFCVGVFQSELVQSPSEMHSEVERSELSVEDSLGSPSRSATSEWFSNKGLRKVWGTETCLTCFTFLLSVSYSQFICQRTKYYVGDSILYNVSNIDLISIKLFYSLFNIFIVFLNY